MNCRSGCRFPDLLAIHFESADYDFGLLESFVKKKPHHRQSAEAELRKDIEARTRLMECMQELIKGLGQANADLAHELGVRRTMAGELVGVGGSGARADSFGAEDDGLAVTCGENTLLSLPKSHEWISLPSNGQNISSADGSNKNGSLRGRILAARWKPVPRLVQLGKVLSGLPGKRQAALMDLVVELVCREFAAPLLHDGHLGFPMHNYPFGIVVSDETGIIRLVNRSICKMTERTSSDLVGRPISDALFSPDLHARPFRFSTRLQLEEVCLRNGSAMSFPVKVLSRQIESQTDGAGHVTVVMEGSGQQERMEGFDDTEHLAREEKAQKTQRMESVGRLAGGIAHDFNNLLLNIRIHSELLEDHLPEGSDGSESLQHIRKASERATVLNRQLLAFSRGQFLRPDRLDLNDVISSMSSRLQRILGKEVELVANLDRELHAILADRAQIEQVLMNLAANARDAMPEGGRVTVSTANVNVQDPGRAFYDGPPPGDYVELTVQDTGVGMSDEVKAHLFEPYFTTKERGDGVGMGLSTVHGIVRQSGGEVHASSELGRGTAFKVFLPRLGVEEAPVDSMKDHNVPEGSGREKTVLLVDDKDLK